MGNMAYEATALANFLLDLGDEEGLALTHMSLHKLIYVGHGWHLAANNQPLVQDAFEAWKYGPVLPTVYDAFKGRCCIFLAGRPV